jgi:hypothetical protein
MRSRTPQTHMNPPDPKLIHLYESNPDGELSFSPERIPEWVKKVFHSQPWELRR